MKKILFSSVLSFFTMMALASVAPVKTEKLILISPQSCTVIVYGLIEDPWEVLHDVSCVKTGTDCAEATALATACRNQNICRKVIGWGNTPPANLGCKVDSFENP